MKNMKQLTTRTVGKTDGKRTEKQTSNTLEKHEIRENGRETTAKHDRKRSNVMEKLNQRRENKTE